VSRRANVSGLSYFWLGLAEKSGVTGVGGGDSVSCCTVHTGVARRILVLHTGILVRPAAIAQSARRQRANPSM